MKFSPSELDAFLDEALPAEQMTRIEETMRRDPALLSQLTAAIARRDAGAHTLGEIWRRGRLSCAGREEWGSYLLGILPAEQMHYLEFHLAQVGCRVCQANVEDLRRQQAEAAAASSSRRRRYFQSSAGLLKRK